MKGSLQQLLLCATKGSLQQFYYVPWKDPYNIFIMCHERILTTILICAMKGSLQQFYHSFIALLTVVMFITLTSQLSIIKSALLFCAKIKYRTVCCVVSFLIELSIFCILSRWL